MKLIKAYLLCVGIIAHLAIISGSYVAMSKYNISPKYIVDRGLVAVKERSPLLKSLLAPASVHPDYQAVSQFTKNSPRILSQVEKLLDGSLRNSDFGKGELRDYSPCYNQDLLGKLSCWIYKRDENSERLLKEDILNTKLDVSKKNSFYGNGWELALAYDSINKTNILTSNEKSLIEEKLMTAIEYYLSVLNDNSASLWHGRAEITSYLWLCYISMLEPDKLLQANVESHFVELVTALELAPSWPEGYTYWINTRALPITLALSSYINGTADSILKNKVIAVLNEIGYWHIYATRPDITIEPIGDEGSRIDLKDESRRVIDVIAQATNNKDFSHYSQLLASKHGVESYYRGYRWGYYLFHNPKIDTGNVTVNSMNIFENMLPEMRTFGEEHYGLSFIRENWLVDGTFMNFKAGDVFTHHAHYDAGHFTLFKAKPLIVNSSIYGEYFGENRLNYSIRTIAKNSIIIQKKNEKIKGNRFFKTNVADGGQRISLPTGSSIQSVSQWYEKRTTEPMLAGGRIVNSANKEKFTYIKADLTKAYNSSWYDENDSGGKASKVERSLFYLREEDTLIVSDFTKTTQDNFNVKSVYHMVNKPDIENLKLLTGTKNNGILSSISPSFKVENGEGKLVGTVFNASQLRIVGGDDYKYYVETDGDDTIIDGKNYAGGVSDKLEKNSANWRLEAISDIKKTEHQIITVLQPSVGTFRQDVIIEKKAIGARVIETEKSIVVIVKPRGINNTVKLSNLSPHKRVYIIGLSPNTDYTLNISGEVSTTTRGGVIELLPKTILTDISIEKNNLI